MTKEEKYAYWLQLAQYDLDTAQTMYAGGSWFYVVFMCQQALEKLSKGLDNFYIDDNVPKTHNITFILAKIESSLSLTVKPEIYDLIDTLSSHYLNNRYPGFTVPPNIHIDKNKATDLLERTKEAFTWLLTLKK
jgi:HEPN domain-containing protein